MIIIDHRNEVKERAHYFINNLGKQIYILGTNNYGLCTANWINSLGYEVKGFINDFESYSKFETFNVYKSIDIPQNVSLINCIVEGKVIIAEENICKLNPCSHIDYFALQLAYSDSLKEITFLEETDNIAFNFDEYNFVCDNFEDEESKFTFESITNFRLNRDIKYLNNFSFKIKEQYFESFIQLNNSPVFIDGGGFDGESTKIFIEKFPDYDSVFYFEPNESTFIKSKERLSIFRNIHFFQKGLWNKSDKLIFDNSLGSASRLSTEGTVNISTVALDEIITTGIDLIKLDIEGAEYNALIGAKKLIQNYKPALAICVYHNQNDFIQIPKLILSFRSDYKILLRHYTQGVFETVMYFI